MDKIMPSPWARCRRLAYFWLTLTCAYWWLSSFLGSHYFNWFITCLLVATIVGFFARKTKMDRFMGFVMLMGSLYMVAAIINAYGRWSTDGHAGALTALLFWVTVFLLSLVFAHLLIFSSVFSDAYSSTGMKNAGTEPGIQNN